MNNEKSFSNQLKNEISKTTKLVKEIYVYENIFSEINENFYNSLLIVLKDFKNVLKKHHSSSDSVGTIYELLLQFEIINYALKKWRKILKDKKMSWLKITSPLNLIIKNAYDYLDIAKATNNKKKPKADVFEKINFRLQMDQELVDNNVFFQKLRSLIGHNTTSFNQGHNQPLVQADFQNFGSFGKEKHFFKYETYKKTKEHFIANKKINPNQKEKLKFAKAIITEEWFFDSEEDKKVNHKHHFIIMEELWGIDENVDSLNTSNKFTIIIGFDFNNIFNIIREILKIELKVIDLLLK